MKKRSLFRCSRIEFGAALILLSGHVFAQSLWKDDASRSMLTDKRAHAAGDVLTILIQQSNTATKDNTTKTSKSSGIDASLETFLYSPTASSFLTKGGKLPALKMSGKNDFSGGGQINNSEKITDRIAVRVVDVLPNQNLVIEGKRTTSF